MFVSYVNKLESSDDTVTLNIFVVFIRSSACMQLLTVPSVGIVMCFVDTWPRIVHKTMRESGAILPRVLGLEHLNIREVQVKQRDIRKRNTIRNLTNPGTESSGMGSSRVRDINQSDTGTDNANSETVLVKSYIIDGVSEYLMFPIFWTTGSAVWIYYELCVGLDYEAKFHLPGPNVTFIWKDNLWQRFLWLTGMILLVIYMRIRYWKSCVAITASVRMEISDK